MNNFTFIKTEIEGIMIIEPRVYEDSRGNFMETYNYDEFKAAGIDNVFVQDNQSGSKKGVLRGLHFQKNYPQAKLVRVLQGEVYDVVVDIRKESPTFGKWMGTIISSDNKRQIFIPKGFAHGFLVLSDEAEFAYKCDEFYHPEDECGIIWNDETIGIEWPDVGELILNEKDASSPNFEKSLLIATD